MRTSPRASDLELRREQRPGWCIATKAEPAEQIYESTSEDAMIETLSGFPGNVAAFACHGHVTKADYDTVLMPDVSDRLSRHEKLRIYYEVAPDFAGLDPGAVWEDTKVGLSHFLRWERFAVVTDVE